MISQRAFLASVYRATTIRQPSTALFTTRTCQSLLVRPRLLTSTVAAPFYRPTVLAASMSSDTSTLPYHLVVGLPALSPTMEVGTLSEWYKNEGDAFQAGDAIAKIETDKAAIDFEAQDDGVVAKILISANDGSDIPVGTPIMITVEDVADVAAFKDYTYTATAAAPVATVPPTAPSPPTSTIAPPPPPPVKAAAAVPPTPAAAPVVAAAPPSPPPTAAPPTIIPSSTTTSTMSTAIPGIVYTKPKSPLAHTLFTEQTKYIELYGTTGQIPIS